MIDVVQYQRILDFGLLLDHYFVLINIRDGKELAKSKRVQGFINLLCKKGYIEDGILTDLATDLVGGKAVPVKFKEEEVVKEVKKQFDYANWAISLHEKCEAKIKATTGRKQVRPKIDGVSYSFLPNSTDLGKVILRVMAAYKLNDYDKVEKCILRYVDRCIKQDRWTPLLQYYIMKKDMSTMVTEMDDVDEQQPDQDTSVNI